MLALAAAGNNQLHIVILGSYLRERIYKHLAALLSNSTAHKHHDFLVRKCKSLSKFGGLGSGKFEIELLGGNSIVDDIYFVPGRVKRVPDFSTHKVRTDNDSP